MSTQPAVYLLRVAHSLGQLQYVSFASPDEAQAELARLNPNGYRESAYGLCPPEQFRRLNNREIEKEAMGEPFLEVVEVQPATLPIEERRNPDLEYPVSTPIIIPRS